MKFSLNESKQLLTRTPVVLSSWLIDIPGDWVRTKVESEEWTVYDVIGHLIHGEKTDWIPRMEIILGPNIDKRFEPFDRAAQFSELQTRTISDLLSEFHTIRMHNLQVLESKHITDRELGEKGYHPQFGEVTLQELLTTWTVHDMAHIAQIARILAKQYQNEVGPWSAYLGILNK